MDCAGFCNDLRMPTTKRPGRVISSGPKPVRIWLVSDNTREPILGWFPTGRMRKRRLVAIRFSRPYCERKSQPIQRSRTPHCSAAAERFSCATHCSRQVAAYHAVSPILSSAQDSDAAPSALATGLPRLVRPGAPGFSPALRLCIPSLQSNKFIPGILGSVHHASLRR